MIPRRTVLAALAGAACGQPARSRRRRRRTSISASAARLRSTAFPDHPHHERHQQRWGEGLRGDLEQATGHVARHPDDGRGRREGLRARHLARLLRPERDPKPVIDRLGEALRKPSRASSCWTASRSSARPRHAGGGYARRPLRQARGRDQALDPRDQGRAGETEQERAAADPRAECFAVRSTGSPFSPRSGTYVRGLSAGKTRAFSAFRAVRLAATLASDRIPLGS